MRSSITGRFLSRTGRGLRTMRNRALSTESIATFKGYGTVFGTGLVYGALIRRFGSMPNVIGPIPLHLFVAAVGAGLVTFAPKLVGDYAGTVNKITEASLAVGGADLGAQLWGKIGNASEAALRGVGANPELPATQTTSRTCPVHGRDFR